MRTFQVLLLLEGGEINQSGEAFWSEQRPGPRGLQVRVACLPRVK